MPVTQEAAREDALKKILAPYDSAEQMTLAQLKALSGLGFALIPTDAPKGFAQELIDGKFNKLVAGAITQARRDWRILHSRLQEEKQILVSATCGGQLCEYLRVKQRTVENGTAIIYEGSPSYSYSIWSNMYPDACLKGVMICRATGDIEQSRLIEALGGKESCVNSLKTIGTAESPYITPQQVVLALDSDHLAQPKWRGNRYSFLVGYTYDGCPLFIFADRKGEHDLWHISEWPLTSVGTIEPGDYLVFAKSLFLET